MAGLRSSPGSEPVAICMATFNPEPGLLRTQVESIRNQAGIEWHCFVSDDRSDPESLDLIEAVLADDARFTLSASPARLGFYRNFERALGLVPDGFELIALCDQDDRWHQDKLASLVVG
ncbi:MAG: glycosyltransferase, partial [Acidobacteriota bacterium]